MKPFHPLRSAFLVCVLCANSALAAARTEQTAFRALGLLPKAETGRLARVIAVDATPKPEKWILLVHDPESETGLKEYVVARGKLLPGQEVSEYAPYLTGADVVDRKDLKIDSDRIFEVANAYALANGVLVASMNYTLEAQGVDGRPVWRVDCLRSKGANGDVAGSVVLSGEDGEVLSHDGFEIAPDLSSARKKKLTTKRALKLKTEAMPMVAAVEEVDPAEEMPPVEVANAETTSAASGPTATKKTSSGNASRTKARRSSRSDSGDVARTVTRPARKVLRRFLPF